MLRFKPNDGVFILPKYSHLYAGHSAVVTRVRADPFRTMFNEYALQFPDGSTATLFEFQIIEDFANFPTFIAAPVFDSLMQPEIEGARGLLDGARQIILQTPRFDLIMRIHAARSRASTMGQVLERGSKNLLKGLEVRLMKESVVINTTMSDSVGIFKFGDTPTGSFNILVQIPQYSCRILGGFAI